MRAPLHSHTDLSPADGDDLETFLSLTATAAHTLSIPWSLRPLLPILLRKHAFHLSLVEVPQDYVLATLQCKLSVSLCPLLYIPLASGTFSMQMPPKLTSPAKFSRVETAFSKAY